MSCPRCIFTFEIHLELLSCIGEWNWNWILKGPSGLYVHDLQNLKQNTLIINDLFMIDTHLEYTWSSLDAFITIYWMCHNFFSASVNIQQVYAVTAPKQVATKAIPLWLSLSLSKTSDAPRCPKSHSNLVGLSHVVPCCHIHYAFFVLR